MALTFKIGVSASTYTSLKKLAALSNDPSDLGAVVSKLVDYWHNGTPADAIAPASEPKGSESKGFGQLWRSPRGDFFPIGLQLRALYLGKTYAAKVTVNGIEFAGKTYDSPSAAAIAVKEAAGKTGAAANTNGWEFWEMMEPATGQWASISALKAAAK
jgi:hypothetical protein